MLIFIFYHTKNKEKNHEWKAPGEEREERRRRCVWVAVAVY